MTNDLKNMVNKQRWILACVFYWMGALGATLLAYINQWDDCSYCFKQRICFAILGGLSVLIALFRDKDILLRLLKTFLFITALYGIKTCLEHIDLNSQSVDEMITQALNLGPDYKEYFDHLMALKNDPYFLIKIPSFWTLWVFVATAFFCHPFYGVTKIFKRRSVQGGLILILCSSFVQALPKNFYSGKAEGWYWFDDQKKEKEDKEPLNPYDTLKESDPSAVVAAQKKALEKARHRAVVNPTLENVDHYLTLRKRMFDQAETFAKVSQQAILLNPTLNENIKNPTANNAQSINMRLEKEKRAALFRRLSKRYGLFFFFTKDCPYCHEMAPSIGRFAEEHGFHLIGVSPDGVGLEGLKHVVKENGIGEKLNIQHVPSLVLYDSKNKQVVPIGSGFMSIDIVERNILTMVKED